MLLVISLGHSGGIKGIVGLTDDHNKKLDHIEIEKKVFFFFFVFFFCFFFFVFFFFDLP